MERRYVFEGLITSGLETACGHLSFSGRWRSSIAPSSLLVSENPLVHFFKIPYTIVYELTSEELSSMLTEMIKKHLKPYPNRDIIGDVEIGIKLGNGEYIGDFQQAMLTIRFKTSVINERT